MIKLSLYKNIKLKVTIYQKWAWRKIARETPEPLCDWEMRLVPFPGRKVASHQATLALSHSW